MVLTTQFRPTTVIKDGRITFPPQSVRLLFDDVIRTRDDVTKRSKCVTFVMVLSVMRCNYI